MRGQQKYRQTQEVPKRDSSFFCLMIIPDATLVTIPIS